MVTFGPQSSAYSNLIHYITKTLVQLSNNKFLSGSAQSRGQLVELQFPEEAAD